jgi:dolichol-phosphate mannosyltransferase
MKIGVIIPTFNEKDNISLLVGKILALKIKGLGVVVVDDNSPDGTGAIAERLARKFAGKVVVVHRKGKMGLGTAYVDGWRRAFAAGAELVFSMDADLSHNPAVLPQMVKMLETKDLVIGSRHMPGGEIVGFTWWRKALTAWAQIFSKWVLGMSTYDSTSGYRGYRKNVIEGIAPDSIKSSGYSFLIEALYRAHQRGYKIVEVPIVFGLRNGGISKVSSEEIIKALRTVLRLRLGW